MSADVLISPRISFSHDVHLSENDPSETFPCSSSTSTADDFEFAFNADRQGGLINESSSADELFSQGKLLPSSVNLRTSKEISNAEKHNVLELKIQSFSAFPVFPYSGEKQASKDEKKMIKRLKEHLEDSSEEEEEEAAAAASTTFWKLRQSLSLNVSKYRRNRGKQSIPSNLNPLSRSKSTGLLRKTDAEKNYGDHKSVLPSVMEDERSFWKFKRSNSLDFDKIGQNRGISVIGSLNMKIQRCNSTREEESRQFEIRRSSSLNCSRQSKGLMIGRSKSTGSAYSEKKGFLKHNTSKEQRQGRRSFKDYYANFYKGERVNPLLNLPSPYISRASVDLLGFRSLFCNGRYKKKKQ